MRTQRARWFARATPPSTSGRPWSAAMRGGEGSIASTRWSRHVDATGHEARARPRSRELPIGAVVAWVGWRSRSTRHGSDGRKIGSKRAGVKHEGAAGAPPPKARENSVKPDYEPFRIDSTNGFVYSPGHRRRGGSMGASPKPTNAELAILRV